MHAPLLLIGFGNPGRGDDGLGPALAEVVRELGIRGVEVSVVYQLAVEHAADLARVPRGILVDASVDPSCHPFAFERVLAEPGLDFTTHALAPARVVALAEELFGARPEVWLLTIGGTCFDPFVEELSEAARANLAVALDFVLGVLPLPSPTQ